MASTTGVPPDPNDRLPSRVVVRQTHIREISRNHQQNNQNHSKIYTRQDVNESTANSSPAGPPSSFSRTPSSSLSTSDCTDHEKDRNEDASSFTNALAANGRVDGGWRSPPEDPKKSKRAVRLTDSDLKFSDPLLKTRIRDEPLSVNMKRKHILLIFKWFLIMFNGLIILMVLGGVVVYFADLREKGSFKMSEDSTPAFSDDLPPVPGSKGPPKYAWIVSMFAFALLVAIPCLGFVGAIKEHICLLVLYGVIFLLEAIVFLIFGSMWFLLPTLVSLASLGLVFLISSDKEDKDGIKSSKQSRLSWCLDKV